jgi:uncharacterized protein
MKNIKVTLKIFLCFLFLVKVVVYGVSVANAEKLENLRIDRYVNDNANIIDDKAQTEIETMLFNHFASTTHQIVVVTVNNINGDYIENYSIKLAEKIKAGTEKNDNGVILLISKEDRQLRIEVGYGLEGVLTDVKSSYVIRNIITPEFKKENYTEGIKNGVKEIIKITNDENYSKSLGINNNSNTFLKILLLLPLEILVIFFFFGIGIVQWTVSVLGRTKSWWLGGVIGLIISLVIYFTLFASLFVFLITIFGFVFDYFISKNYKEHISGKKSGPPDWWAGGSTFGGGSGWTNSSGGFSGGGGSFGGGGSSGNW